jgi:intracellular sulfur oxidation DsrE/DsrF family protein
MTERRRFLARLAALGATIGITTPTLGLASSAAPMADDPWIAKLKGKQRVIFHAHEPTGGLALRWAQTFIDTQKSAYGLADADSSVVVGLNGKSIGWLFNDAIWAKHPTVGEVMAAPGAKNPQTAAVAALLARGAIILACNNSIRAAGQRFLPEAQRNDAAARTAFGDEAKANLLPGIEVVPAMVVTLQQAQDHGCRYVYAGG